MSSPGGERSGDPFRDDGERGSNSFSRRMTDSELETDDISASYLQAHSVDETIERLGLPSLGSTNVSQSGSAQFGDRNSYMTTGNSSIYSLYGQSDPDLQHSPPLAGNDVNSSRKLARGPRPLSNASNGHVSPKLGTERRPSNASFGPRSPTFSQQPFENTAARHPSPNLTSTSEFQSIYRPAQSNKRPTNPPPLPSSYSQPPRLEPLSYHDNDISLSPDVQSFVEVEGNYFSPTVMTSPPLESPASPDSRSSIHRLNSQASNRTQTLNSLRMPTSLTQKPSLSPQDSLKSLTRLNRQASYGTLYSLQGASYDEDLYADPSQAQHFETALLSNLAIYLKDNVPSAEHTRGAIPYPDSFTGSDLVSTIERGLTDPHKSRYTALHAARSLHSQLFFFEVRDNTKLVYDSPDQVFVFAESDEAFGSNLSPSLHRQDLYEDLPTGVLVDLTSCYSPLCARLTAQGIGGGSCLSPSCPNNMHSALLKRQGSQMSEAPSQKPSIDDLPWAAVVDKEILKLLDKREIERQNRIHELINGEVGYVRDIEILRTDFLEPIQDSEVPIIHPDAQLDFFDDVLYNAFEVKQVAQNFADALLERQREEAPIIQRIGDVIASNVLDWTAPYVAYARHHKLAESRLKHERSRNTALDQFLNSFHRRPAARKLDLSNFLIFIVQRLQRYKLFTQAILDYTDQDNHDRLDLKHAVELIDEICQQSDAAVADTSAVLECRSLQASILSPSGNLNDLELYDEQRRVLLRGRMYRRPESSGLTDWTAIHVILFDNYRPSSLHRGKGNDIRYQLSRRPIPLQLLTATGFDEPPQPKSGRILRSLKGDTSAPNQTEEKDDRLLYPITFNNLGRQGGLFMLYAESANSRTKWREQLIQAISARESIMGSKQVISFNPLSMDTFKPRSRFSDGTRPEANPVPYGRPTCSTSWNTPERHQLIAIGHEDGLWIGLKKDPSSYRLVLHLKFITQCAVLQDFSLLLVLANKVLIAYPLDALVPSATSANRDNKDPQKLSGNKDVLFFKVGKVGPRLLVIYVKKDGVTQTVFKALEPIALAERGPKGFMRKRTDWFREYKEFFIPSDVFGLLYLRSQLSIVCAKGFELMAIDKEPLRATSFPDWSQLKSDPKAMDLQKRCNESKAVGMYRLNEQEFLFVFEDLAFYADKHGDPVKERYSDIIDWQGTARNVALLLPYVVAFDTNFVEVRHATTGRLVQIIKGREILCTSDGQDPGSDLVQSPVFEQDRKVHIARRIGTGSSSKDCYQVAELVVQDVHRNHSVSLVSSVSLRSLYV